MAAPPSTTWPFLATDLLGMRQRCRTRGVEYRERTVPSLGLHQVFVEDPSGVTIELNFPATEALDDPSSAPGGA